MKYMDGIFAHIGYIFTRNKFLVSLLKENFSKVIANSSDDAVEIIFCSGDINTDFSTYSDNKCDALIDLFEKLDGIGLSSIQCWGKYHLQMQLGEDFEADADCSQQGKLNALADEIRTHRKEISADNALFVISDFRFDFEDEEYSAKAFKEENSAHEDIEASEDILNSFAEDLSRYMSFVDDDTLLDIASDWIFNIFGVEC